MIVCGSSIEVAFSKVCKFRCGSNELLFVGAHGLGQRWTYIRVLQFGTTRASATASSCHCHHVYCVFTAALRMRSLLRWHIRSPVQQRAHHAHQACQDCQVTA